jgi:transcriptional regulator with XRE-family HTH domain
MPRRKSIVAQFGSRLRALRKQAGLTQPELAERAELASETISRMETGKWSNTTIEVVERLATALGVALTAFFEDAPTAAKPDLREADQRVMAIMHGLPDRDAKDVARALHTLIGVKSRRRKQNPR